MQLKIKNGKYVYNEDETIIAVMTDDATEEDERSIKLGSEAIGVIEEFIKEVKNGSFKPRSAVKKFESLIEKYS